MRNLQEQVKNAFCHQKLFWPFTVWINCSIDLKNFANSRPSASNFKSFSQSLEHFFLTVGQNNFGNKIPFLMSFSNLITLSKSDFVCCSTLIGFFWRKPWPSYLDVPSKVGQLLQRGTKLYSWAVSQEMLFIHQKEMWKKDKTFLKWMNIQYRLEDGHFLQIWTKLYAWAVQSHIQYSFIKKRYPCVITLN